MLLLSKGAIQGLFEKKGTSTKILLRGDWRPPASPAPEGLNYGRKAVLIKLLTLFSYWTNQMEKLIAAVKIFLLTWLRYMKMQYSVKPLNRGNLRVIKNLSVIKKCPLLGGSLTKVFTFGTKHFLRYSRHARYLGCPLLGGFTVTFSYLIWKIPNRKNESSVGSFLLNRLSV